MDVCNASLVPADVREATIQPVQRTHTARLNLRLNAHNAPPCGQMLTSFLDPLLHMCRLSAEGLDTTDTCVFLVNNITTMQSTLIPYSFTAQWVQKLSQELERWEVALVSEQVSEAL